MTHPNETVLGLLPIAVVVAACNSAVETTGDTYALRDSAGVRVVEYSGPPTTENRWIVADSAAVDIGSAEDEPSRVFGRVSGVTETSSGEIVVADGDAQELRAFGPAGEYRWTAGGEGRGPGEFTSLATIYTIAGDSLVAVDHFARALSVFDAEGRFSRTFRLAAPTRPGFGSQAVRGILEEGTAVVSAAQDFGVSSRATGYRRDPFLLLLYDPLGNVRTEIGQFPDLELTIEEGAGGPFARPVNMGRSTLVATMQDGVVVSTTDRFEIRRYGLDGTLELIIRVLEVPPAVDGAVRSAYIRHQLEQIDDDDLRARVRVNLERSVLPQYLPALGDLHTDDRGRVWVQEFVPPYDPRAPQWWIFDTAGDVVAVATLPTGFRPYRIADDHVLGVALDSLGVGHVQSRLIYR